MATDTLDPRPLFWCQQTAECALSMANSQGRLARAYLFLGPEGVGKWAAAIWVSQCHLCCADTPSRPCGQCDGCRRVFACTHPDWHALFPVRKATAEEDAEAYLAAKQADPFAVIRFPSRPNIGIDRIRELVGELNKTSVEGGPKVAIIVSADQMLDDAQSALLKSIEEPPPGAHFILTSSDASRILPTVRSRCQIIRFSPADSAVIAERLRREKGVDSEGADEVAELCGGGWGTALRLAEDAAQEWRRTAMAFWEKAFHVPPGLLMDEIERTFRRKGLDHLLQAFDVWALLLRRDCARAAGPPPILLPQDGAPIRDLETGWACWRILQNGRSTLWVNVLDRTAVSGTFLTLRSYLGCG